MTADRQPSFEPIPMEERTGGDEVYSDPLALCRDERFTVGQRLAALVRWRSQVTAWLGTHADDWNERGRADTYRQLLVDIDEAIGQMLERLRRIGQDEERDLAETI
jgi:hypothetical protein